MDNPTPVAASHDLSALAWVHEELRKTLEAAHKALRRYLRDAEASRESQLDDVEPTGLRVARQHIHQGVGALELVNMPEGALLLRASEAAVQRFIARPGRIDGAGVDAIEHASFALLDFMGRRLAGKPAPAVALFPQLRALLEINAAERIHPADLWLHDWRWRDVADCNPPTVARTPGDAAMLADFERRLLMLVRSNSPEAAAILARDCGLIATDGANSPSGAGAASGAMATFWRIAAAYFEAWSLGLLGPDVFVKRTASRVMAQLRARVKGDHEVSDRLAQDLLFYCARAWPPEGVAAPWLEAVQRAYRLQAEPELDYGAAFYGRFDPGQIGQARKRVAAAKEAWNGVAGGELHRLGSLIESFSLVGDSVRRLYPAGGHLAGALTQAANHTGRLARPPAPALAMEVATSLLYLDAALEEAEFDQPGQVSRTERLAQRIDAVAAGAPSEPLDPWMEELYRRVSDRQTMGSVVQELRSSLSDAERQIDLFFRNPRDSAVLRPVPGQLASMRGVLSVLGVEPAVQASARMREDIEHLLGVETDPHAPATLASFQRLAGNLGALGFLIDMLSVQPLMARSLFKFDAESGILAPVMGRSTMAPDLLGRAQAIASAVQRDEVPLQSLSAEIDALSRERQITRQPALAASLSAAQEALGRAEQAGVEGSAREHVAQALQDFVATATSPVGLEPVGPSSLVSKPIPLQLDEPPVFMPTGLEDDAEMREVFLEESLDVLGQARSALAELADAPSSLAQLTMVRRAFHTLKGSARMVGLAAFGEAAWACEQLYNHWLAEQAPASADLRTLTGDALQYFDAWVGAIALGQDDAFVSDPVVAAADALRLAGELMRVHLPGDAHPAAPAALPTEPMDFVSLDLEVPSESPAFPVLEALQATRPIELAPEWMAAAEAQRDMPELVDFALDFGDGTAPPAAAEAAEAAAAADMAPAAEAIDRALHESALDLDLAEPPGPRAEGLAASEAAGWPLTAPVPAQELADAGRSTGESTPLDLDVGESEVPPAGFADDEGGLIERIEVNLTERPESSSDSWRAPLETRVTQLGIEHPEFGAGALETATPASAESEPPAEVGPWTAAREPETPAGAQVIRLEDFRASATGAESPDEIAATDEEDEIKVIGPLRLQIPLFNIYLNEADELSRRLTTELAEWSLELHRPVGSTAVALAHSLAGSSFTVGFDSLAQLARDLEHALAESDLLEQGEVEDAALFSEVAEEIRRLLHQFAAGFLRSPPDELVERLRAWQVVALQRPHREALPDDDSAWASGPATAPLEPTEPATVTPAIVQAGAPAPFVPELSPSQPPEPPSEPLAAESLVSDLDLVLDAEPAPAGEEGLLTHPGSQEVADGAHVTVPPDLAWPWLEQPDGVRPFDTTDLQLPDLVPEPADSTAVDLLVDGPLDHGLASIDLPLSLAEPTGVVTQVPLPVELTVPELTLDLHPIGAVIPPVVVDQPAATVGDTHRPVRGVGATGFDADIDQQDQIDAELFPIFEEEAEELMPRLGSQVAEWLAHPGDAAAATACMRTLHTFKGSARLAGAMRLGELAHRFESAVDALLGGAGATRADLEALQHRADHLAASFEALRGRRGAPSPSTLGVLGSMNLPAHWVNRPSVPGPVAPVLQPLQGLVPQADAGEGVDTADAGDSGPNASATPDTPVPAPAVSAATPVVAPASAAALVAHDAGGMAVVHANAPIDWARFLGNLPPSRQVAVDRSPVNTQPVRVRAPLLDRLVNLAGEVSITRTRLEAEVGQIRSSLADLTDNLERLNQQLHDIALQAETQLESRMEAARAALQEFDPLELDRYTRLQELTRMMAESVNDVATVRSAMQRTLQTTEDELAVQARLTRELQSDLLRTRMIEFESLSERLYRVVRQASKEMGKQVRFDIVGGSIEVDRGVLDRMTAAFEHLLRNCVTHGIEMPEARTAAGKDPTGSIVITVEQEGNEVSIEIRDDGAGLDLARIRARAVEMGLLKPEAKASDKELANLIMAPGLSTMSVVTELAGRGVGMDVVRSDVHAMGGRVETRTNAGRGTRFKLVLPLTTVVTQVVILRAGERSIAVPSNLVELVQRATPATIAEAYEAGTYGYGGLQLPFYWLGALLQSSARGTEVGRTLPVVIVRSAQQRVALHVDEVQGSHEVVVKNLGPQLSSLPGLAGMTLLPSGAVALIYNPVALSSVYGAQALHTMRSAHEDAQAPGGLGPRRLDLAVPAPLVLVVDDSLTVRRITKRLLEREGYRVVLAKDGLDALDVLGGERPVVVLSDIEMPRMDGFDLLRNIRGDASTATLPVIMITSRIAQKHRDIAIELGANQYLGKPYREDELLALIRQYAGQAVGAGA